MRDPGRMSITAPIPKAQGAAYVALMKRSPYSTRNTALLTTRRLGFAILGTFALPSDSMLASAAESAPEPMALEVVAEFPKDQVTGVAVTPDGRVFVNFPYWSDEHSTSVAEISSAGLAMPYPNPEWNAKEGDPKERFVCVQSVHVDDVGALWVLDAGSPKMEGVVSGAPKLVLFNIDSNTPARVYPLGDYTRRESYLNDVRVDQRQRIAYLTDSGVGALIVLNLETGEARRVLEGHPSVQPEQGLAIQVGEKKLMDPKRPDQPFQVAADSLALDREGGWIYYKPLSGRRLYRIRTQDLQNAELDRPTLSARVEDLGTAPVSDGFIFRDGFVYITAIEQSAIVRFDPESRKTETVIQDERLQWPDSLFGAKDGLYITTSQIHLTSQFNRGEDRTSDPFRVFKLPFAPAGAMPAPVEAVVNEREADAPRAKTLPSDAE